jgi:subtilase family serine protease
VTASATGAPAGSFTVGIYLSTDAVITSDDTLLAERQVSGLAPGEVSSADTTVSVPASIASGPYYIGAVADTQNQVIESDETNNTLAGNQIIVTGPDLSMTAVSGPVSGITGGTITVNNTVTASASGGSAGGFSVGIYLSADNVVSTTDSLIGYRWVDGLAPGASSTDATAVVIPSELAGGVYYIGAIADYTNAVPEADESNNARAGNQITVTGPDLTVSAVSGPGAALTGDTITVSDTVTASAAGGGAGASLVGIYLSTDNVITTADILLDSHYVPELAPGGSYTASTPVTIPAGLSGGAYYIGAIADMYNQVAESDETNNARAGNQITITKAYPDLVATSASGPGSATTDQQITVTSTVKNQGQANAGPSWASVYLSTDATITASDILLGDAYVVALDAGAEVTLSTVVTIPANLTNGTYYIGVIADRWSQVTESNESNNSFTGNQIVITRLYPDLVVTAVSGPATGILKQQITVTARVKNQGQITAAASYVGIYLSSDQTATTGDLYLGQGYIGYLAPGADQTVDVKVTVPQNARGTFYLGAVADRLNAVAESSETNNGLTGNQIIITRQ